jgi:hypothetical protein
MFDNMLSPTLAIRARSFRRKRLLRTFVAISIGSIASTQAYLALAEEPAHDVVEQPAIPATPAPTLEPAPGALGTASPPLSLEALGMSPAGASANFASQPAVDYSAPAENRTAANYLWPLADVLGINLFLWSIPYTLDVPWAQVNPSYWKENFQSGWQWDDNEFEVNQFAHPYQGGMYFTAARIHGLSFWEAVPYAMFGSFQWEFFMETEQPSTNDWLTTTWGGFLFGESLYRLSNRILDDSTSGGDRFWREFAAFAVNPVNGIDRVISGQAWADGPPGERAPLAVNLRVGADGIGLSEGTGWGKTFRAWIRFDYGDLYSQPAIRTPFEVFNLSAQLSGSSSIFGQGIDGTGVLLGERFFMGASSVNLFAWTLNFEYFTNGTTKILTRDATGVYSLGEMGTGPSWYSQVALGAGFRIDGQAHVLAVPTGAMTSPYAKYEANRSYNYGLGGALKLELNLRHERLGRLYAKANRYLYYIVDGASGTEHVGLLQFGAFANVYGGHGLGATVTRYDRNSYYEDYPNLFDSFWSGQVHYEVEF